MKILKNIVTIIVEISILILGIIWFLRTKEEEPIIVIIGSSGFLIASVLTKIFDKSEKLRPKVVFHRKNNYTARIPKGITPNNPEIIYAGDLLEQYWELHWVYELEIRNNSSVTAYNYSIEFENKPNSTEITGEIGKIQPIKIDDSFKYTFKLIKHFVGNHLEADQQLKESPDKILNSMKIIAKYDDEFENNYTTDYDWITDTNKFK